MIERDDLVSGKPLPLKRLHGFIAEAESAHREWRRESWFDSLFRDGKQWTERDRQMMVEKGINPLTINRVFPIINMICGTYAANQHDIITKGRSQSDAEMSQVMSEALKFVLDQNGGYDMIFNSFESQIVTGFGAMGVEFNSDPRFESVKLRQYPWYSIWWDMYANPWMDPETCRYVFYADWKDLDSVAALVPRKRKELYEAFGELTSDTDNNHAWADEGTLVEEQIQQLANGARWADKTRKRVRPVEMWYTVPTDTWFAVMMDGSAIELRADAPPNQQYALVEAAQSVVKVNIRKIRVATILGNLVLRDVPSPLPHDQYPFVPYVGYLDTFRFPFGVPRQIREQNMEVNKRRSMALSLINNRRVIMEKNSAEDHNQVYEEVNAQDGLIILNDGKSATFEIQELGTMAPQQMDVMVQSEREMQEISGANNESLGYKTAGSQSNMALETKQKQSNTMTASLMLNLKRSQRMLGERVLSHVQKSWTGPKVLRVTDRVTGAEKFTEVNMPQLNPETGGIEIRNNLTQGRYDVVVTDAPLTDTVRDKNLELIFSAIQKSPPEAVGPLLALAFDLSDIPQKDQLLHQVRMNLGVEPIDPLLTSAEAEEKAKAKQAQLDEQKAIEQELIRQEQQLELEKTQAEIEKILAEAKAKLASIGQEQEKIRVAKQKESREAYVAGHQLAVETEQVKADAKEKRAESNKSGTAKKAKSKEKSS